MIYYTTRQEIAVVYDRGCAIIYKTTFRTVQLKLLFNR